MSRGMKSNENERRELTSVRVCWACFCCAGSVYFQSPIQYEPRPTKHKGSDGNEDLPRRLCLHRRLGPCCPTLVQKQTCRRKDWRSRRDHERAVTTGSFDISRVARTKLRRLIGRAASVSWTENGEEGRTERGRGCLGKV